MANTLVLNHKWQDTKKVHVLATLTIGSGSYTTGGLSLDVLTAMTDSRPGFVPLPGVSTQPLICRFEGIAGYKYEYDRTNKKLIIRSSAAITPAGTISAPTITSTTNAGTTTPLYTNGGALTQVAGATGITGVQAPTFTGTAVAAAAMAELAATTLPAGVTGDTIQMEAIFQLG